MSAPNQFAGGHLSAPRGRGAGGNPPNRFEHTTLERDAEWNLGDDPAPRTQFLRNLSQMVISYNDSPDNRSANQGVFVNRHGESSTRYGVHVFFKRYACKAAAKVPTLRHKHVGPKA
jgi:hypothetical protein